MKEAKVGGLVRVAARGRPYREADRARALEYARGRQREGATVNRVAGELGISHETLKSWMAGGAFERVEIVTEAMRGHTLCGPRGVRVEGLTLDEIAELLRRLS